MTVTETNPLIDPNPAAEPALASDRASADSAAGDTAISNGDSSAPIPIEPGIGDGSTLGDGSDGNSGTGDSPSVPSAVGATTVVVEVPDPLVATVVPVGPDPISGDTPELIEVDFSEVCIAVADAVSAPSSAIVPNSSSSGSETSSSGPTGSVPAEPGSIDLNPSSSSSGVDSGPSAVSRR